VLYHPDLTARAVRLFAVLDRFAGDAEDCYPSRKKLARKMGCSPATVDRALAELVEVGAVEVSPRRRTGDDEDGGQTSNLYTLHGTDPKLKAEEGATQECTGGVRADDDPPSSDPRPQEREPSEREPVNETSSAIAADSVAADVVALCNHLADRIAENGSKRPTVTQRWIDSCRLLIVKDGRTPEQIRRCIDWCQDDEFWRANVMSMPTLRAKYDTLRLRAKAQTNGHKPKESAAMSKGRRAAEAAARARTQQRELSA